MNDPTDREHEPGDPVSDVRRIRERFCREAGNDVRRLAEASREAEELAQRLGMHLVNRSATQEARP